MVSRTGAGARRLAPSSTPRGLRRKSGSARYPKLWPSTVGVTEKAMVAGQRRRLRPPFAFAIEAHRTPGSTPPTPPFYHSLLIFVAVVLKRSIASGVGEHLLLLLQMEGTTRSRGSAGTAGRFHSYSSYPPCGWQALRPRSPGQPCDSEAPGIGAPILIHISLFVAFF
jgi:hypothetical protein